MKIMYVHGYGSRFDAQSNKCKTLSLLGEVCGVNVDYAQGPLESLERILIAVYKEKPDVIVGTSMGGWAASLAGSIIGLPFVAINPCTNPGESLKKYIGQNISYGEDYNPSVMTKPIAGRYEYYDLSKNLFNIKKYNNGLIFLAKDDEVIPYERALGIFTAPDNDVSVVVSENGGHRYENLYEGIGMLEAFCKIAAASENRFSNLMV